jgi:cytochrome c oxidase subunit 2
MGLAAVFFSTSALASGAGGDEILDWGMNLTDAASPVKERMVEFHNMLLWIISGICLFVLALLIYVVVRFNHKANPTPSRTTHNVPLEIAWTIIPVIILIIIAVPSFKLLYYTDRVAEPEMTLKVIGYQWFWGYEYPDYEISEFQSYMVADDQIDPTKGQKRLLSTDYPVILPVDTDIEILVTAGDVLHSFAMPAFGIKTDAVPGRLNHTWVRITKPGTYYGQCSELCGANHAYMPIEVRAVPKEQFEQWVALAKDDLDASYAIFDDPMDPPSAIFNIDEEKENAPDPVEDEGV